MITLPVHTFHGLQPLDVSYFKPFKVAFRAYKNVWYKRNNGARVKKEDLASWVSLATKKTLTSFNIMAGFKGIGIWPLDLEAMKDKMGSSKGFLPQTPDEVELEEEVKAEILQEEIPPPPCNVIHYYVDNKEQEKQGLDLSQKEVPTQTNINNFLRLPQ